MTGTILLIRHAAHGDLGSKLSGRSVGGDLVAEGLRQADLLAHRLAPEEISEVHSSPVARALQTAGSVSRPRGLPVTSAAALDEIDFGKWTGLTFDELAGDPAWQFWNEQRASARAPGGETMQEVQQRAGNYLAQVASRLRGEVVAMVSHCDVIRAMVARILGLSLDHLLRFDIAPASVTRIEAGDWGARLISLNEVAA